VELLVVEDGTVVVVVVVVDVVVVAHGTAPARPAVGGSAVNESPTTAAVRARVVRRRVTRMIVRTGAAGEKRSQTMRASRGRCRRGRYLPPSRCFRLTASLPPC
jgi:hypothetical protein